MENVEHADVTANKNSATNETEPKIVANTESVIESGLKQYTGPVECLVMAIGIKDGEQPEEDSPVVDDVMPNVTEVEFITKTDDVPETMRPTNDEGGNIRESIEAPITIIEAGDPTTIQTNDSVEMVTSTENQENDAETKVDGPKDPQSPNEEPTSKIDNVSQTKSVGSLGLLVQYISSSDDEDNESNSDNSTLDTQAKDLFDKVMSKGDYRVVHDEDPDESESEYEDSDVECVGEVQAETIDITNDEDLNAFMDTCDENGASKGPIKAKGEFGIDDLPPIANLTITVPESECIQLGTISGMVETLVLVESLPNFAAVDIDTVLFLDKGNRTLGQVFDVMGNVASPIYCVRFNKAQDIVEKKITIGAIVYVAPKTEHTSFIVLSELINQKGTDASWEDDIEPPTGCGDFSDDEEERIARRSRNQKQRNRNRSSISSDCGDGPLPNKLTVKRESFIEKQRGRNRRPNDKSEAHQFYKDNRGYASTSSNYTNFHQNRPPRKYDHSWHTAGIIPSTSTAIPIPQGYYPNPFAMPHMNYGYFNLQAFPPLPPPMSMQQQPPTNSRR